MTCSNGFRIDFNKLNLKCVGIPQGAILFGIWSNGQNKYFCRARDLASSTTQPGYWQNGVGCIYEYDSKCVNATNFDVLIGSGLTWQSHTGGRQNVITNMYGAGTEPAGDIYLGRQVINGELYLGKISTQFYTCNNGANYASEDTHEIAICKKS